MKQVNIYDLSLETDYEWSIYLTDRNGYPLDLTGKTMSAKVVAFNDSIYEYTAAVELGDMPISFNDDNLVFEGDAFYIKADPINGIVQLTITAGAISEMQHFIHTYYLMVDDEIVAFGTLRPTQEYHNILVTSPNRLDAV